MMLWATSNISLDYFYEFEKGHKKIRESQNKCLNLHSSMTAWMTQKSKFRIIWMYSLQYVRKSQDTGETILNVISLGYLNISPHTIPSKKDILHNPITCCGNILLFVSAFIIHVNAQQSAHWPRYSSCSSTSITYLGCRI